MPGDKKTPDNWFNLPHSLQNGYYMRKKSDITPGRLIFEPQTHDYYGIFVKLRFEEATRFLDKKTTSGIVIFVSQQTIISSINLALLLALS